MRRWSSRILTTLSLLLWLAAVTVWIRSYRVGDRLVWHRLEDVGRSRYSWSFIVSTGRGGLSVCKDAVVYDLDALRHKGDIASPGRWSFNGHHRSPPRYPTRPFFSNTPTSGGFAFHWTTRPDTVHRDVIVPLWAIALPAAILPAVALVRLRHHRLRRRRLARGLCPACGYDLRATTAGPCPECGTVRDDPRMASNVHE